MFKVYIDLGYDRKEFECSCFNAVTAELSKLKHLPIRIHIIQLPKV